jgi:D-tyrosyl-tRNA(Tyr) deacylase
VRAVLQRVSRASVTIDGEVTARIGRGLVVLVGVAKTDGPADTEYVASKVHGLRLFPDADGRLQHSVFDAGGSVLVVSQFTILGDVRRGRRPSFDAAAPAAEARRTYEELVARLAATGLDVATGRFQAHMHVELVNDGPVTVIVDSQAR